MASTQTTGYGTKTEFANTSNLGGLATGAACGLGPVDNSTAGADGFLVYLSIPLASTGVNAAGTITVYLIESLDGTNWTDGIDPAGASVASSIVNAVKVKTLTANANGQVVQVAFRLPVIDPAPHWALVVLNGTGAGVGVSASPVASYTPITYALS